MASQLLRQQANCRWLVKLKRVSQLTALIPGVDAPVSGVIGHHDVHAVGVGELEANVEVPLLVQVVGKVQVCRTARRVL